MRLYLYNITHDIVVLLATDQHLDGVKEAVSHVILGQFSEYGEERAAQLVNGDIHGLVDNRLNVLLH